VTKTLQLQKIGDPEMSEKWIACGEPRQVTMVDLANNAQVTRRPIQAEAAIMNPARAILAIHSGMTLQVFNLESKSKMKSYEMPDPVVFWRWTSPLSSRTIFPT
jgi:clathrin heavy chain